MDQNKGIKKVRTFIVATLVVLAGCGGSGGGGATSSPFAGTFNGTWVSTNAEGGSTNITVAPSGSLSGSIHNVTRSVDGTLAGRIGPDGSANITYQYVGESTVHSSGSLALSDGDTTLSGVVTDSNNASRFTLTRQ